MESAKILTGGGGVADFIALLQSIQELESKLDFTLLARHSDPHPIHTATYPSDPASHHTASPSRHSKSLAEESENRDSEITKSSPPIIMSEANNLNTESSPSSLRGEAKAFHNNVDCHDVATQNLAMTEPKASINLNTTEASSTNLKSLLDSLPTPPAHGWDRVKISHIAQISRGASPRPINNFLTTDSSGVNWIKIGDVAEGAKYITKTEQKITQAGAEKSKRVKAGDFILSNSMSAGRPYILKIDGCIHDGWLLLSHISDKLSKDFLYYALLSDETQRQFDQRARGSVVKNLNTDLVASVKIPLPPLEAQEKIISVIERIESQIASIDSSLESLEARKAEILANALNADNERERERTSRA